MNVNSTYPLANCEYCPKPVFWAHTGKSPLLDNAEPAENGNIVLLPRQGSPRAVVNPAASDYPHAQRYTAHFDSCPGADQARKPKEKAAPQTETLF